MNKFLFQLKTKKAKGEIDIHPVIVKAKIIKYSIYFRNAQTFSCFLLISFFSIGFLFHDQSRITGLQGKGEEISLTTNYHFQPLHRHLDNSWAITAKCSPLHIGSNPTRTQLECKSLANKLYLR